jgi:hypothetical protein
MQRMLIFKTNGTEHLCDTFKFNLSLEYEIDPGWRETEFAALRSLEITSAGYFTIPGDEIAQQLFAVAGESDELLTAQFELRHTDFDIKRGVSMQMSSLPLFPGLDDFASIDLPNEVCERSTLWVGNFPRGTIEQIRFAASQTEISLLEISGVGSWYDRSQEKEYSYSYLLSEKNVPFAIRFFTRSAKTDFPHSKKDEVVKELRECFRKLYGNRGTQYSSIIVKESDEDFAAVEFMPEKR